MRSDQQGRDRPVDLPALLGQVLDDVVAGAGAVAVPAPVEELDVAHAALDQPAGQQAVVGERRRPRLRSVLVQDRFGLLADVHHVGNGHLHAEGQLVLADPRQRLGVAELGELVLVELPQRVESAAAVGAVHALGVADVENRDRRRSGTARPGKRWAESRCSRGPCRRSGRSRR